MNKLIKTVEESSELFASIGNFHIAPTQPQICKLCGEMKFDALSILSDYPRYAHKKDCPVTLFRKKFFRKQ